MELSNGVKDNKVLVTLWRVEQDLPKSSTLEGFAKKGDILLETFRGLGDDFNVFSLRNLSNNNQLDSVELAYSLAGILEKQDRKELRYEQIQED